MNAVAGNARNVMKGRIRRVILAMKYTNMEKRLSDNFFNEKWLVSSENLNPLNNFW
jgi:allophanate hydrolase subunit 2